MEPSPKGRPDPKANLGVMLAAGTQLMVSVLLGVWVGRWLDARWNTGPWMVLAGATLGISVGLYNLIRESSRQQGR